MQRNRPEWGVVLLKVKWYLVEYSDLSNVHATGPKSQILNLILRSTFTSRLAHSTVKQVSFVVRKYAVVKISFRNPADI